jgi:hypothetical protein
MLRGNLSTRPFYNERLATLAIAAIGVAAALLTVYNATALFSLTGTRRDLNVRIERDQTEAARIRSQTTAVQRRVDPVELSKLAASTGGANDLIDQRMFSWSAFFTLIEKTLPTDVRLVMVSPRVERGVFKVAMTVVARNLAEVSTFVDALGETGKFYDTAPVDQQRRDDGDFNALIETSYLAPDATPKVQAPPAAPTVARPPR